MPRYVAFLRGVSPMNCSMPQLKRALEQGGFENVRTLLSSGNVAFDAQDAATADVERRCEEAMQQGVGRSFYTIVRRSDELKQLLADEPYTRHGIPPHAKRVVTFFRDEREPRLPLPLVQDFASCFCVIGREAFSAYVPGAQGPVFMKLIERAFGSDVTTRTWDTVAKCAAA